MPKRRIKQGECLFSIAAETGLPWTTLWDHPQNADLKAKRTLPNVLFPGDIVFVPDPETKEESSASEQKHKFKSNRPKTCIRLRLLYEGEPLKKKAYELKVDGKARTGETDDKGDLEELIEATAKVAELKISEDASVHALKLGYLDPVDKTSGLQARLNNLGFDAGDVDGDWGKTTRTGMQGFQADKKLEHSNKPNDETRKRLEKEHGS